MTSTMKFRILIGAAGVALGVFGVFRLLTQVPLSDVLYVLFWLIGALILHDGVLSPILGVTGVVLGRVIKPRARGYVQGGLVAAALVTVIALPMIYRAYSLPASKAILEQDFSANLGVLVGIIAGATLLLYVLRIVLDRNGTTDAARRRSETNVRPPTDQDSSLE